jgi:hypothetical protein
MIRHTTGGCKHHYKHHQHGSYLIIILFYVWDLLDFREAPYHCCLFTCHTLHGPTLQFQFLSIAFNLDLTVAFCFSHAIG